MILNEELLYQHLHRSQYATLVSMGKNQMTSRTMTVAYVPEIGIFTLTPKGSSKLEDIAENPMGLFHIFQLETEIAASFDISISGHFEPCDESSPNYRTGFEALGKINPQVLYLLNSDARADFELLLFRMIEIRGFSYEQAINNLPKTVIRG